MSTRVITPPFIASYAYVWEARSTQNEDGTQGEPKFSMLMLFDKSQDMTPIKKAIKEALEGKWGNRPPKSLRNPLRDGDAEYEDDEMYTNRWFVRASSKTKPGILDRDKEEITDPDKFYSGCIAVATINAFAYDVRGNRGISFGLNNIVKLRNGPRLDGRISADKDFEDVDVDTYKVPDSFGSDDDDEFGF